MCTRTPISIKRIFIGVAVGTAIVAIAAAWIFFPSAPARMLTNTAAIVAQSWNDTFGGPPDEQVSVIDLGSGGTSSSDSDSAARMPEAPTPEVPASPTVIFDTGISVTGSGAQNSMTQNDTATDSGSAATGTPAVVNTPVPAVCTVAVSAPLSRKLIFNEIAWMGSPQRIGESALAASGREWMELKNISGAALDISGWQVLDAKGSIKIIFDTGTIVPAGGLVLLEHGDAVSSVQVDATYSGALSNAGTALAIVDVACGASDILDSSFGWSAGNNETKQTCERDADGLGWHTSVAPGGTPKAENSVPVAKIPTTTTTTIAAAGTSGSAVTIADVATATNTGTNSNINTSTSTSTSTSTDTNAGTTTTVTTTAASSTDTSTNASTNTNVSTAAASHLVIVAVQIAGASSTNDFVKIFNPTAGAVDMSGWKLRKKSKSGADYSLRVFPSGSSVGAGGYFMWANSENGFGDSIAANATSTATLAADNSAALLNASGTIIDAVAWGEGTGQYVEGAAYPANPEASQVLERKSAADGAPIDTNDNANDFFVVP